MRIHHGVPSPLANSSTKAIDAGPSSDRRDFIQVLFFGSLLALSPLLAGCASTQKGETHPPPNRMKGGGNRGGNAAGSHR
jgi:hypothetical protein